MTLRTWTAIQLHSSQHIEKRRAASRAHISSLLNLLRSTRKQNQPNKMRPLNLVSTLALGLLAQLAAGTEEAAVTTCSNYSVRYTANLEGVCVCTEASCDSVANTYTSLKAGEIGVYRSSKAGDRLKYEVITINKAGTTVDIEFTLNLAQMYQQVIGFGGAFTDAAAINTYKLTPALQQKVLDAYFSEAGLEYSTGRIPISSSDFSESIYSYNPVVDDFDMTHFSIGVDKAPNSNKLTLIQRALKTSKKQIKMFASSWAPPVWMTQENSTLNCHVKGVAGGPYWKALALYYSKFIDAYKAEGVDIWGMTVQNEPGKPIIQPSVWQSLRMSGAEERDFIKKDLGPLFKQNHPNVKIIAGDDQKADIADRMEPFDDADSRQYLSGLGVHWYKNLDFFISSGDFDKLKTFHDKYPDLFILATEQCEGYLPSWLGTGAGVKITDPNTIWARAENYGRDIIGDLNNFAGGWTDWNLVLDTNGGPNWAKNYVDAPILVDEVGGKEFYKQPMYYIMGHFSKFLPAGSVRFDFPKAKDKWSDIDRTAFITPEKRIVLFFFNRRDSAATATVQQPDENTFTVNLPAHSIQTIILPPSASGLV
ncbi:putative glucosylceramidase 3, partial [Globisporangium splendens]